MSASTTILVTRRPRRGGGFTVIELIAVLLIVAVLAAAAVPSLDAMADTRSAAAARQLQADLTFARQRAVATGSVTWVVFDVSAETWSVLVEDPADPGRASATVVNDPATGRPFVQQLGVGSFVSVAIVSAEFDGDVEVGFDWLGRPLSAVETDLTAAGTVTLTGGHVVSVARATGHVTYTAP
jgi:prepilin-type N-terminal cleavage/methylation domain-containing protein